MQRQAADDGEDEPLELTEDMEAGPEDEPGEDEDEEETPEPGEGDEESPGDGDDEGPPQIAFEDDEPAEGDSSVIRSIRERNKQLARENAELRTAQAATAQVAELPDKPTLADCDYDEEKYEAALTGWHDHKRKADDNHAAQIRLAEDANREWARDMENFNTRRAALNLPDFEDSSTAVQGALNLAQQAVVVKAASDSAAFVYALGRSDARLAELAKIQDPIKMAAAVARMEGGIKIVKKRKAAAPDRPQTGSGRTPGGTDKQMEKLEAEAERTGDRTAIIQYRKKLAARGKK